MSRSNPTHNEYIAKYYFQWNGETGGFRYYDKEKKQNIPVSLPFRFLVLDMLSTIKGWNDAAQSGYWSNEIRSIKSDRLTVKNSKGIVATGTYGQLKANRACPGIKYVQSVYVAWKDESGELIICNIQIQGSALGEWMTLCKDKNVYEGVVEVTEMTENKKGKTVYQVPVFKMIPTTPETDTLAKELDKKVQKYLASYFSTKTQEDTNEVIEAEIEEEPEVDNDEKEHRDDPPF